MGQKTIKWCDRCGTENPPDLVDWRFGDKGDLYPTDSVGSISHSRVATGHCWTLCHGCVRQVEQALIRELKGGDAQSQGVAAGKTTPGEPVLPELPPGWRLREKGERMEIGDYVWHEGGGPEDIDIGWWAVQHNYGPFLASVKIEGEHVVITPLEPEKEACDSAFKSHKVRPI